MTEPVLDASAVLALLQAEPGHEVVAGELATGTCPICAVNLSEVAAKLTDGGLSQEEIKNVLSSLDLQVHAFDRTLALESAWLRASTRDAGLSLGDRACLALAKQLSRPALTADRTWRSLSIGLTIQLVRR